MGKEEEVTVYMSVYDRGGLGGVGGGAGQAKHSHK